MNDPRALPKDIASQPTKAGLPGSGSRLQVSSSALTFDHTELGDESYLTLKITPPKPNTLIVVSVDESPVFQIAAGVERLAYKQALTFKPEQTGSYIHLRYTPERSGKHQATLTVESPATAEAIHIPMTGRTIGIALPAVNLLPAGEPKTGDSSRSLATKLLFGGLVAGLGYTGYVYRCDLWPGLCNPSPGASATVERQEDVLPREPAVKETPLPRPAEAKSSTPVARPLSKSLNRPDIKSKPAEPVGRRAPVQTDRTRDEETAPVVNVPAKATQQREEPAATTRKETSSAKPAAPQRTQPVAAPAKPAAKPNPSDESELERVLNRGTK